MMLLSMFDVTVSEVKFNLYIFQMFINPCPISIYIIHPCPISKPTIEILFIETVKENYKLLISIYKTIYKINCLNY